MKSCSEMEKKLKCVSNKQVKCIIQNSFLFCCFVYGNTPPSTAATQKAEYLNSWMIVLLTVIASVLFLVLVCAILRFRGSKKDKAQNQGMTQNEQISLPGAYGYV